MIVTDILHACAHRHVAEAAILSIGGDFASTVRQRAAADGVSVGDYTAAHVQTFSRHASEGDRRLVAAQIKGEDLALLSGLRHVLQRMMADEGHG